MNTFARIIATGLLAITTLVAAHAAPAASPTPGGTKATAVKAPVVKKTSPTVKKPAPTKTPAAKTK